ncbi:MAG: saccharopine dehydrogenase NADP-binding domain-containing protein [Pseudomonadota bacterium]
MQRVLLIGGYGAFGQTIAQALAGVDGLDLIIAGRSARKANALARKLEVRSAQLDVTQDLSQPLQTLQPDLVIHCAGPFQKRDYSVAHACIAAGCHYIDLADARDFVAGIDALDAQAKARDVAVISGASSVPCLTAAVMDAYLPRFQALESLHYGISAAQRTARGVATAASILTYVGQPFQALEVGAPKTVYGWQSLHSVDYPELGRRWFGDCDVPDLALFPQRYPDLKTLRFAAGNQLALLHWSTWAVSWAVRWLGIKGLGKATPLLLGLAKLFDPIGSDKSGFHMIMRGQDAQGKPIEHRFYLIARQAHGPYIPCIPAILLAKRLAHGQALTPGARPCLDLITLDDYLEGLAQLDITAIEEGPIDA